MKAIYINLDPYVKAVVDAAKASTTPPAFNPLPLAVTIPVGETAAIYAQTGAVSGYVSGVTWSGFSGIDALESGATPGLSQELSGETASVYPVSGSSIALVATIADTGSGTFAVPVSVLVRRETISGPVDLLDYTPPESGSSGESV